MSTVNLTRVFSELRTIMLPYAQKMDCKIDREDQIYVDTNHIQKNGKPLFFGAVQIKKNYVSYHLMPVYLHPRLLETVSPELKKCMQGKSCFNFKSVDGAMFSELAKLTEAGFVEYQREGYS